MEEEYRRETEEVQEQEEFSPEGVGVDFLPTLSCVGYITAVPEGKISNSQNYLVQPVEITAEGAGTDTKVWITYRPEWFAKGFDPRVLKGMQGGGEFLYGQHVAHKENLATLPALAGSKENYRILYPRLCAFTDIFEDNPEQYLEKFSKTLRDFIHEYRPKVGYVLTQTSRKTGEVNEKGKAVYELTKFRNVTRYFYVTEENLKNERKLAQKTAQKISKGRKVRPYYVTFDEGQPF